MAQSSHEVETVLYEKTSQLVNETYVLKSLCLNVHKSTY